MFDQKKPPYLNKILQILALLGYHSPVTWWCATGITAQVDRYEGRMLHWWRRKHIHQPHPFLFLSECSAAVNHSLPPELSTESQLRISSIVYLSILALSLSTALSVVASSGLLSIPANLIIPTSLTFLTFAQFNYSSWFTALGMVLSRSCLLLLVTIIM